MFSRHVASEGLSMLKLVTTFLAYKNPALAATVLDIRILGFGFWGSVSLLQNFVFVRLRLNLLLTTDLIRRRVR